MAAAGTSQAGVEIDALGAALVASPSLAEPVLDALAKEPGRASAIFQAEVLLRMATSPQGKKSRTTLLTDGLAERAAALLDCEDWFVRGLAEWAIAIRVGVDNDHRSFWPRPDPPPWFARWSALSPGELLDLDYARQGVALGIHRSGAALLASADEVMRRLEGPAAEIRKHGTPEQREGLGAQWANLQRIHARLAKTADPAAQGKLWLELRRAARQIVISQPELDFPSIAFITRYSCVGPHNLASYSYHPSHYRPGGDVLVQSGLDPSAPARPVIAGQLGPGHIRGVDLWWDADRLCFGYTRQPGWTNEAVGDGGGYPEPTHVFEINLDGTGLRQLTHDEKWIDTEPTYLADGSVVFGSDRPGIGSECGGWEQNAGVLNLYRVFADGKTIRRLTVNKDYDRYPHSLDNGLIAFLRWDYAERQFFSCHSIWTVRPDGTMADALYKSHVQASPYSLRDARSIPGTDKLVAIACGHHNLAEGAVTIVDPNAGVNNAAGMRYVTPRVSPTEGGYGRVPPVAEGGVADNGGLYQTPWALSEKTFLVSYAWRDPPSSSFAIYLIDVWGNKELLHRDLILDSACPMPVRKRPRPPWLPDSTQPGQNFATLHLSDVYHDLPGVARGTVKWLRISERVNWVFDKSPRGELRWLPANPFAPQFGYWSWAPVRVIGLVPVAQDGSAHFRVPAGMAVYFQALDEHFMEIRRMRSHIAFQPGETRACLGCHESKSHVTPSAYWSQSLAAANPPARPLPPPWGDREILDYEQMIQPILNRHCTRCHGHESPKGGLDLTADRQPDGFAQSYRSLFGLQRGQQTPVSGDKQSPVWPGATPKLDKEWYAKILENRAPGQLVAVSDRTTAPWTKPVDASISQPLQFGSHRSKLVLTLLNDPLHQKESKLSAGEWLTLVTWVDANAPYASTFFQKFSNDGQRLEPPQSVRVELPPPFPGTTRDHQ